MLTVHFMYDVGSSLQFEVVAPPPAGSVLILSAYGSKRELLRVAPSLNDALSWVAARAGSDRFEFESVQPDGTTLPMAALARTSAVA